MKTIICMFLLVGSLLMGANAVTIAGDGSKKDKTRTKFVSCAEQMDQIKSLIGCPDIVLNGASELEVSFAINEDNTISVLEIKTDNKELEAIVFKRMNGKKIRSNEVEVKCQSLKLIFVSEKEEVFTIL